MRRTGLAAIMLAATLTFGASCAHAGYIDQTQCKPGMVSIDSKFCIDKYEYPNHKGEYSLNAVTWNQAAALCAEEGKRLCDRTEWQTACMGPFKYKYPYGDAYRADTCSDPNVLSGRGHYPAGQWDECVNAYGVYDMSGNLWEWTSDSFDDGSHGVQGGSALTENLDALSCITPSKEKAGMVDNYIGFRCCTDISATDVRGTLSPVAGTPTSSEEKGFIQTTEYVNIKNIVNSPSNESFVSASGMNIALSYQFNDGRMDYTRTEYRIRSTKFGAASTSYVNANTIHGAVLIASPFDFGKWTGNFALGDRYMQSRNGSLNELYFLKEFNYDRLSLTPMINYVQSNERGDKVGYGLDARYRIMGNIGLTGSYSKVDIYKMFINNHIVPASTNYNNFACVDCKDSTSSAGLVYLLPHKRGGVYFMMYDIGDIDIPVGGTTIHF